MPPPATTIVNPRDASPPRPNDKDTASTTPTDSSSSSAAAQYHEPSNQSNFVTAFIRKCFRGIGDVCASQPWEVLVTALFVLLITLVVSYCRDKSAAVNASLKPKTSFCSADCLDDEESAANKELVLSLTLVGCQALAFLHIMYRFKKILRIGPLLILSIAATYLSVTLVLYATIIWAMGGPETSFRDGWFLIPLLLDMPKVTRMSQFALSSSHSRRRVENISNGMYVLAPPLVLDSGTKILLFGLGFQTGIQEFGTYAWYAVVSVIVNLLVYLIFYPVGLSILLDLMFNDGRPTWDVRQIINTLPGEESQSPVVHRVKVLTTALLLIVHIICLPNFIVGSENSATSTLDASSSILLFLSRNLEKVFLIFLVLVLFINYFFYEDMDEASEMRKTYIEELKGKFAEDSDMDRASNSTDEGISIGGSSTKVRPPSSRGNDDSSSESAWSEVGFLPDFKDQEAQTIDNMTSTEEEDMALSKVTREPRCLEECTEILASSGSKSLTDEEIVLLVENKVIRVHDLENKLHKNYRRGVEVRRRYIERKCNSSLNGLPFVNYDYETVMGACCESVIGYMTVPVGVAGPLNLDGNLYHVPMATTEGCLVASVNRGCSALRQCGVTSRVTGDGMTRGPIVRFPNISKMADAKAWMEKPDSFKEIKKHFDSTSRFAKLQRLTLKPAGRELYIRFVARTGDAMGMNMLSKATEKALAVMKEEYFPEMDVVSLSGNFCTDKKPAAVNWLDGRGKSLICEALVPCEVVHTILKTTPAKLVDLNRSKNLVGSALAGSIGGFNAQAANVVTAVFIATGQDAAQNVASSNCLTQMEVWENDDLYITVTMPSIEVGTVGGGTILTAQGTCLDMLGIRGSHPTSHGDNATMLARIVCATVLAGELSLMSALQAGHLVSSHLRHNRSHLSVSSCNVQEPPVKTGILRSITTVREQQQQDDGRAEEKEKKLRS